MVVAALLLPLLVLNALGGTAVLAQCNEGDVAGLHLHAVGLGAGQDNTNSGAKHDHDGCGGHEEQTSDQSPHDESLPTSTDTSACPVASASDHGQLGGQRLSGGGIEVGKVANGAPAADAAVFALLMSLTLDLTADSPEGGWGTLSRSKPMHLSALSAGDRIIRVSRALII